MVDKLLTKLIEWDFKLNPEITLHALNSSRLINTQLH